MGLEVASGEHVGFGQGLVKFEMRISAFQVELVSRQGDM